MRYEVIVELKPEVLDSEGRAIYESLSRLGLTELKQVQVSKRFVVELESANSESKINEIADSFLANPVAETFRVREIKD